MLKSLRTARFLAGLTLVGLCLSVAAPVVLACEMEPADDMHASTPAHQGDEARPENQAHHDHGGHSVVGTDSASPKCESETDDVAPASTTETCCDEQSDAGAPCRPASVSDVPYFCSCSDVDVNARADRTRIVAETSWTLNDPGSPLPVYRGATRIAQTGTTVNPPVPDLTILYGCFLI